MKKIFVAMVALVMIFNLSACGSKAETASTESVPAATVAATESKSAETQVLSVWLSNAFVSEAELKMPQDEWYVSKIAKEFEAQNPGVKVEITVVPDASAAHQTFKAAAATDSGPDVVNLWSGQNIFAMKDIILDITNYIPAEDKEKITGWETDTLDFKEGNPILGYPTSGQEVTGFMYNRAVLKKAGLDFDNNPPKSIDEFVTAMQAVKDAGFTPIAAAHDGWNGAYYMSFASLWAGVDGNARVASDSTGETKFADDEAFLNSYRLMQQLYKDGLINQDYLTIPSIDELFLEGNTALEATGNWAIANAVETLGAENVGFWALPVDNGTTVNLETAIGGPGQVLVVSKKTKNPELAVKFISFMNNRENHINLLKGLSKLPIRTDVTAEDVGMSGNAVYDQVAKYGAHYIYWADNSMVPEVTAEMTALAPLVITGKMTVEEMAAKLDIKAAEVAK